MCIITKKYRNLEKEEIYNMFIKFVNVTPKSKEEREIILSFLNHDSKYNISQNSKNSDECFWFSFYWNLTDHNRKNGIWEIRKFYKNKKTNGCDRSVQKLNHKDFKFFVNFFYNEIENMIGVQYKNNYNNLVYISKK